MSDKKAAPIKPWELIDPKPLPESDAQALAEVLDYAEMIANGESQLDGISMQKATAIEKLYKSEVWVNEWMEANPPKPDAIGRPVVPNSRNRFQQWQAWRAKAQGRTALGSRHTNQLLKAAEISTYGSRGSRKYTERTIRPLAWMLTRDYAERIEEVWALAREIADGQPITNRVMSKAMSEWKKKNLGAAGTVRANRVAKAKNYRSTVEADFGLLLLDDPKEAREFIKWAADQLRAKAKELAGE